DVVARAADVLEHRRVVGEELPLAEIDAERDAADLLLGVLAELDELRRQHDGQIVDAVEPQVLEDADRRALSRSGEPGDDDDVEQRVPHDVRSRSVGTAMPRRRAISSSSRAANSRAVWRPRPFRTKLRAATSMMVATLRPGRIGIRTFGSCTPRMVYVSSSRPRRSAISSADHSIISATSCTSFSRSVARIPKRSCTLMIPRPRISM